VIFGAGNRLRPDGPYLDLYREFKDVLAEDRQVIVIGYSFRDAHVNEAVCRWVLEHGQEGALLRIGSLTDVVPPIVNRWMDERELAYLQTTGLVLERTATANRRLDSTGIGPPPCCGHRTPEM
jgi:hypothetical protein